MATEPFPNPLTTSYIPSSWIVDTLTSIAYVATDNLNATSSTTTQTLGGNITTGTIGIGTNMTTGTTNISGGNINVGTVATSNVNIATHAGRSVVLHLGDGNNVTSSGDVHLLNGNSCAGDLQVMTGTNTTGAMNVLTGNGSTGIITLGGALTSTVLNGIPKTNRLDSITVDAVMAIGGNNTTGQIVIGDSLTLGDVLIGTNQTSGAIDIGTSATRTGLISIGKNCNVGGLGTGVVYSNAGTLTSTNPSDASIKKNILTLDLSVDNLNPVQFEWIDEKMGTGIKFGFLANEINELYPNLCSLWGEDKLGIDSVSLIPVIVSAVKKMKLDYDTKISNLEQRLLSLEKSSL